MTAPRTDPPTDDCEHARDEHNEFGCFHGNCPCVVPWEFVDNVHPAPRTDPQSTVPVEPLSQLELDAVRIDLDPDDAYQYGGWAHLVARLLATLDALPVREDEPTGIDVERLVETTRALVNALDYVPGSQIGGLIALVIAALPREASHVR